MLDFSILTPKVIYEFALRWLHLVTGVAWIGLLYWFNLVNVNFQKNVEADLKPKVNPILILPTLWFFRWAAVLTWVTGFLYYGNILAGETISGMGMPMLTWIATVGVTYAIIFFLIRPEGPMNNGYTLAAVSGVVILVMASVIYKVYDRLGVITNPSYMIGIGGGLGTIMFLNVWGIIWPSQKRVLGVVALAPGEDKAKFARRAFLASRMNAWLSIPLLFFMGASSHLNLIHWG